MMRYVAVLIGMVAGMLLAYAVAGMLAAFIVATAAFVVLACWLRSRLATPRAAEVRPPDRFDIDPRRHFTDFASLEVQLASALRSRRIYDHTFKPRLFRLALTLLSQQRPSGQANAATVRGFVGADLWPIVDPSVMSYADEPHVNPAEIEAVLTRFEELL